MGKTDKNKKKGKGAEKTAMKTDKKIAAKQKKMLEKLGEVDISEVVRQLEFDQSALTKISEEVCSPPSPRSCFTFISHPDKEELILFGGEFFNGAKVCVYNDLFFYNIGRKEWRQIRSPSGPTARSSHQMVAISKNGGELWLFGGEYSSPSQLQFYHYKDLWMMNLQTRIWQKITTPNGPSARSGHRMIASKSRLIIFGGFHDNNQNYKYFNDVHIFCLETYVWVKVEISNVIIPPPRSGCCMAAQSDGKVVIWGGYSKNRVKKNGADCGVAHTDMYALITDKSGINKYKWTNLKAGGFRPLPYSSVGCTTAPNGKVYCFGGVIDVHEDEEDLKGQFGKELISLDLNTLKWRLLEVSPKSLQNLKSEEIRTTNITKELSVPISVKTDGIFTVTVACPTNICATTSEKIPNRTPRNIPSPRMNPGLAVCKHILYVYGGLFEEGDKQFTLNDFYALDIHKLDEWKTIIPSNLEAHDWIDSSESEMNDSSSDESSDGSDMDTE